MTLGRGVRRAGGGGAVRPAGGRALFPLVVVAVPRESHRLFDDLAPRLYYAMARDGVGSFGWPPHPRTGAPLRAIGFRPGSPRCSSRSGPSIRSSSYFVFVTVAVPGPDGDRPVPAAPPADAHRVPGYPVTPVVFLAMLLVTLVRPCAGTPRPGGPRFAGGGGRLPVYRLFVGVARRSDSIPPPSRSPDDLDKTIPFQEADEELRWALEAQNVLYPREYERHPGTARGDRRDSHPDPGGALSRLRHLRGADVAVASALAGQHEMITHGRIGHQSVPLLNHLARRVSASGHAGCEAGGGTGGRLHHGPDFGAGSDHAGLRGPAHPGRHAGDAGPPPASAGGGLRRPRDPADHADRGPGSTTSTAWPTRSASGRARCGRLARLLLRRRPVERIEQERERPGVCARCCTRKPSSTIFPLP